MRDPQKNRANVAWLKQRERARKRLRACLTDLAALKQRDYSQAVEIQQQQDISEWSRHMELTSMMHSQLPLHLRAVFTRLRAGNVIDAKGEFTAYFLSRGVHL